MTPVRFCVGSSRRQLRHVFVLTTLVASVSVTSLAGAVAHNDNTLPTGAGQRSVELVHTSKRDSVPAVAPALYVPRPTSGGAVVQREHPDVPIVRSHVPDGDSSAEVSSGGDTALSGEPVDPGVYGDDRSAFTTWTCSYSEEEKSGTCAGEYTNPYPPNDGTESHPSTGTPGADGDSVDDANADDADPIYENDGSGPDSRIGSSDSTEDRPEVGTGDPDAEPAHD